MGRQKSFESDKLNQLRTKRVESYQENEKEQNFPVNSQILQITQKPYFLAKNPPLLNLLKAKSDIDFFQNIGIDQSLSGNISPSNQIQTPLPTTTCSKRLTKAKSSLQLIQSRERAENLKMYAVRTHKYFPQII